MASYHFPILVGKKNEERVVMVHLTEQDQSQLGYRDNRVVFATTNQPLFKVMDDMNLICSDGSTVKGRIPYKNRTDEHQKQKVQKKGLINILNNLLEQKNNQNNGQKGNGQSTGTDQIYQVMLSGKFYNGNNIVIEHELQDINIGKVLGCSARTDDGTTINNKLIELTFTCSINNITYSGSLNIIYCTEGIAYTNIDLGSDATQIYVSYGETSLTGPVNLVDELVETSADNNALSKRKRYLSQYFDGKPFYRTGSILFKEGGVLNDNDINADYINYLSINIEGERDSTFNKNILNEAISIPAQLTKNPDLKFKTYPNIKVVYHGQLQGTGNLFSYKKAASDPTLTSFTNTSIPVVLTSIFKKIIEISLPKEFGNEKIKYQSVLILVPNIYTQYEVEKLLDSLNKKMNNDLGNNQTYYDFRAMSESDAAFLGNLPDNEGTQNKKKDLYLIIDSGRGTTDYTLISRSEKNKFVALRRGGVVGAGSAIDYVFALIYANHLKDRFGVADNDFEWHFIEWLNHLDSPIKEKIRLSIEKMKISFIIDSKQCNWEPNLIDQTIIHSVITADDKRCESTANTHTKIFANSTVSSEDLNISDAEVKMIYRLCDKIADAVIKGLDDNKRLLYGVDRVIYTGRSFQFKPLINAFEQRLEKYRLLNLHNGKRKGIAKSLITLKFIRNLWFNGSPLHENLLKSEPGVESKQNTIEFSSHEFNINLNSDLCCLPDFMDKVDITDKKNREFSIEKLINGIDFIDKGKTRKRYYTGYDGVGVQAFIPAVIHKPGAIPLLVNMTIYPEEELNKENYQAISNYLRTN